MRRTFHHALALSLGLAISVLAVGSGAKSRAQALPATAGETLTGKPIVLAGAVKGHATILVVGFSKDAGAGCGDWIKALHADPALASVTIFQVAMLEQAPGFLRGMIESGMRKGLNPAEQDRFVVLVHDERLWRSYFAASAMKDPFIELLDAGGQSRWHGHGAPKDLEPLLRAALR
jgi:hypothetical protein